MAWFKVDDRLWAHPKWIGLGAEARALWITAGSYCAAYETDGTVSPLVLPSLVTGKNLKRPVKELVDAGLWGEREGEYYFINWDEYQPSKAQQQAKREKDRERKAQWRSRRDTARNPSGIRTESVLPDPTRPVPIKETNNYVVSKEKRDRRATLLPDTWQPSETHQTKAFNLGLNCAWEADKFRDHHGAKGTRFKNWDRAFHNWLNHAAEYAQRDGGYHAPIGYGTPPPAPPASSDRPRKVPIPDGLTEIERTAYRIEYKRVLDATQNPQTAHDRAMKILEK